MRQLHCVSLRALWVHLLKTARRTFCQNVHLLPLTAPSLQKRTNIIRLHSSHESSERTLTHLLALPLLRNSYSSTPCCRSVTDSLLGWWWRCRRLRRWCTHQIDQPNDRLRMWRQTHDQQTAVLPATWCGFSRCLARVRVSRQWRRERRRCIIVAGECISRS